MYVFLVLHICLHVYISVYVYNCMRACVKCAGEVCMTCVCARTHACVTEWVNK